MLNNISSVGVQVERGETNEYKVQDIVSVSGAGGVSGIARRELNDNGRWALLERDTSAKPIALMAGQQRTSVSLFVVVNAGIRHGSIEKKLSSEKKRETRREKKREKKKKKEK